MKTRTLPPPSEWVEHIRAGVRTERVELDVSDLALRTVAGPAAVRLISAESPPANGDRLALDGHLLAMAIEQATREPQHRFHDLGAEFAYPLAPLLNELRVQGGLLLSLADALNAPDERQSPAPDASLHPRWAETRELYAEGCAKAAELLFPEALEWLRKAEERYPTDFSVQFELGWVYLYGVSRDDSVFDPTAAEGHLRRAARYGQGAVRRRPEMAVPAAETMLHLAVACRLLGRTDEALALCTEASRLNPKLSQACYHRAKYAALAGRADEAVAAARAALALDRRFAVTLDSDRDLAPVVDRIRQMLDEMRAEARQEAERAVAAGEGLDRMQAESALLKARLQSLETRLRNIEARAAEYPADYGETPGVCTDVRRSFDEEGRNARRALEKLGRVTARAESSLAEAGAMFEQCRQLRSQDTLFALQDVLLLATDATTPLHRASASLADAVQYGRTAEEHIPRMEGQIGALAIEAARNRVARRNWRVTDLVTRVASRLPGFVIAGALAGAAIRVAIYFAAGQSRTIGSGGLLSASLVPAGLGAAAGAVAAAFRAVRRFRPVGK